MAEQLNGSNALKQLLTPARNHYFYGKLLDVFHFQMEQTYFNRKRWLLNRLGFGSGVLCGLEVALSEDGQQVWLQPGVALDALGREIIVSSPYCLENPRQLTDECGLPLGDPIVGAGVVTLCLAYHECEAEPVPVLVGDCDTKQGCAPSTIRERYMLLVREGVPEASPGHISDEQCQTIFPLHPPDDFNRRETACATLGGPCLTPDVICVPLATVTLPEVAGDPLVLDGCGYRTAVYSNTLLFDLLMCLADRVDECCRTLILRYVSGDAQQAEPGQELAEPLVVELVDEAGEPVPDEAVTFRVRGGGGVLTSADVVVTDDNGRAQVTWQIGPVDGLNTLEASIASGAQILFMALGVTPGGGELPVPPVVMDIWPPNAAHLPSDANPEWIRRWLRQPQIAITFDREMNEAQLREPEVTNWLRVWQVLDFGEIVVRPLPIDLMDIAGSTATYSLSVEVADQPARYLVQMRAEAGNITDINVPPLTLDAEFVGSRLSPELLDEIWRIDEERVFGERVIWDSLVDTGAVLPQSGDGVADGRFNGWFEVLVERG